MPMFGCVMAMSTLSAARLPVVLRFWRRFRTISHDISQKPDRRSACGCFLYQCFPPGVAGFSRQVAFAAVARRPSYDGVPAASIRCCIGREREKAQHQALFAGAPVLSEQSFGVVGIFDVLVLEQGPEVD
jgi:hypothetical protein